MCEGQGKMNHSINLSPFLGVLLIITGVIAAAWGFRIWRQPHSLRPNSKIYRYLLLDWQTWPRKKSRAEELTDEHIKYYGVRGLMAGALLVIVGIVLLAVKQ